MRRWVSNVLVFVGIPAVVFGVVAGIHLWQVTKRLDFDIDLNFGDRITTALRVGFSEEPDLEVAPGAPGYVASLDTVGPQLHYYADGDDQTTVAGDVPIAGRLVRIPVAEYYGRPSREVGADRLRPVVFPFGFVVVRVVDDGGEQCGRTRVTIENLGDSPSHRGTQWPNTGVARFIVVRPGTYAIGAEGVTGEVTVGTQETVWCTLSPSGLTVDERESRNHAGRDPR